MMKPWFPLAVLLGSMSAANADDAAAPYGLGANSCSDFVTAYTADPTIAQNVYFAWATGFMSGLNVSSRANNLPYRQIGGTEAGMKPYMLSIGTYCDAHLTSPYYSAVVNLYNSLPPAP